MDDQGISSEHDYVLIYAGSLDFVPARMPFTQNAKQFTGVDSITGQNYRPRSLRKEGKGSQRADRPNLYYPIKAPNGTNVYPIRPDGSQGRWRVQIETYENMLSENVIEWVKIKGEWQAYVKQFYDEGATRPYTTIWPHTEVGHNHEAVDELKKLFGESVFSNPKPTRLVKRMLDIATEFAGEPEIVLDFFSGSSTTAHAALLQNHEKQANWRFLMVQLPEPIENKKYPTIAEIGKERIRLAVKQLRTESRGKLKLSSRKGEEDWEIVDSPFRNCMVWFIR